MFGVDRVRRKPPNRRRSRFENYFPKPDFVQFNDYVNFRFGKSPPEPYNEEEVDLPHDVNIHALNKKWLSLGCEKSDQILTQ